MGLSDETLDAMRHGRVLQIAWLSDESVSASLIGAAQGIADLKTCGAQVAGQHRAQARAQAAARASAMADQQLIIARAQAAAAEAARQRAAAEAEEMTARVEQDRAIANAERQRALARERQRALAAQQYYYGDRPPAPPQTAPWGYYRSYDYPR
jgi:hypothetical protein